MNIEAVFNIVDIHSAELERIVSKVMGVISLKEDIYEENYGSLYEGITFSGELAEVTDDGSIRIDWTRLRNYDEDIAMAIIAHEIAHIRLKHYGSNGSLEEEHRADEQAELWGFNIKKFRKVCGPPVIKV